MKMFHVSVVMPPRSKKARTQLVRSYVVLAHDLPAALGIVGKRYDTGEHRLFGYEADDTMTYCGADVVTAQQIKRKARVAGALAAGVDTGGHERGADA